MRWLDRQADKALGIGLLVLIAFVVLAVCAFGQAILDLLA